MKELLKNSYGYPGSKKFVETIENIEAMRLVSIETDVVKIEAPSKEKALFLKEKLDWRLKIFVEEVYGINKENFHIVYGYR